MSKQIAELLLPEAVGTEVIGFFLCLKAETRKTASGKPYCALILGDQTGEIETRIWGVGLDLYPGVEAGVVVKIGAWVEVYEGKAQLKVEEHKKFRAATEIDGVSPMDFMRRAERPAEEILADLDKLIDLHCRPKIAEGLREALDCLQPGLGMAPAAMKLHHPYIGGLLEHTLSLADAALWAADTYKLDRSIMLGIAICHDLGKVLELDPMRGNEYTRDGRLFGHIAIGYYTVKNVFEEVKIATGLDDEDERIIDGILHGILSHHGSQEKGSPVPPCTREAIAFHYLDMLDSRMSMFTEAVRADGNQGQFTEFNRNIGGALWKG